MPWLPLNLLMVLWRSRSLWLPSIRPSRKPAPPSLVRASMHLWMTSSIRTNRLKTRILRTRKGGNERNGRIGKTPKCAASTRKEHHKMQQTRGRKSPKHPTIKNMLRIKRPQIRQTRHRNVRNTKTSKTPQHAEKTTSQEAANTRSQSLKYKQSKHVVANNKTTQDAAVTFETPKHYALSKKKKHKMPSAPDTLYIPFVGTANHVSRTTN